MAATGRTLHRPVGRLASMESRPEQLQRQESAGRAEITLSACSERCRSFSCLGDPMPPSSVRVELVYHVRVLELEHSFNVD